MQYFCDVDAMLELSILDIQLCKVLLAFWVNCPHLPMSQAMVRRAIVVGDLAYFCSIWRGKYDS